MGWTLKFGSMLFLLVFLASQVPNSTGSEAWLTSQLAGGVFSIIFWSLACTVFSPEVSEHEAFSSPFPPF